MNKHTPGPWLVETYPEVHVKCKNGVNGVIAFVELRNAPLIAAAPKLLEAARRAHMQIEFDLDNFDMPDSSRKLALTIMDELGSAIDKAEGKKK